MVEDIATVLSSEQWLSTQSTAYMLLAVSKYIGNDVTGENLKCELTVEGIKTSINSTKPIYQSALNYTSGSLVKRITVTNQTNQNMYVKVIQNGIPLMTQQEAFSENLNLNVRYYDTKDKVLNPELLKHGTDFYAEITVSHPDVRMRYSDLALHQLFPSGWEIINSRMDEVKSAKLSKDEPTYQDIRDDRVYMYFDLEKGQKKVFRILLHAAYTGTFYMPSVLCEAMYDHTIQARTSGKWVKVVK